MAGDNGSGTWYGWWPYAIMLLVAALAVVLIAIRTHGLLSRRPEGLRLQSTDREARDAPRFSTDLRFDPYPSTINIENRYDCNADSLRVCLVDDPTTLFGCKELAVRCVHFDRDTEYKAHGTTRKIPANARPNEGYALALTTLMERCNPYHGNPVLVAANAESNEYMLLCECKNPGYIGNEHLLGACDTPFICDGKVDSIDKPLENIECRCGPTSITKRYSDGMPVCKRMLVHEANQRYDDWSSLVQWRSPRLLETRRFNPTVRDNVRSSVLLNPCTNSIHDTSVEVPNATFEAKNNTCRVYDYGYPVATDIIPSTKATQDQVASARKDAETRLIEEQPMEIVDETPQPGKRSKRWLTAGTMWRPDRKTRRVHASVDMDELKQKQRQAEKNLEMIDIGAVLATGRYNRLRFTDNLAGKRKLVAIEASLPSVDETASLGTLVMQAPEGIGLSAQIGIDSGASFIAPRCEGSWPRYHCYMNDYFNRYDYGFPRPGERSIPSDVWFPWNQEDWYKNEQLYRESVIMTSRGFSIDQSHFTGVANAMTYGVVWYHREHGHLNGILSFHDQKAYDRHRSVVT